MTHIETEIKNTIETEINKDHKQQGYVVLVIDDDGSGMPWEGGINGTFYRISRGTPVSVPENLARLIRANKNVTLLSNAEVEDYKSSSGKRLG